MSMIHKRALSKWVALTASVLVIAAGFSLTATSSAQASAVAADSFTTSSVTGTWEVPQSSTGTNSACLTAGTDATTSPIPGCAETTPDAAGAGVLHLTSTLTFQVGAVFNTQALSTSQGLDATFTSYQYWGSGADGINFALAAADPSNPTPPATTGAVGGSLGYSSNYQGPGLPNAYLGVGLDVFGNYTNSDTDGWACPSDLSGLALNQAYPESVTVRGPGNGGWGYCELASSATATRHTTGSNLPGGALLDSPQSYTRAGTGVPVEVALNPTNTPVTATASGLTVPAMSYLVAYRPIGVATWNATDSLTGALPTVSNNSELAKFPSSWINPATGIPYVLTFGLMGTTGGWEENHEISNFSLSTLAANPHTCTMYWTGATSSAWETASNWSLTNGGASAGRVPNALDTVCMSTTPVTPNATISSNVNVGNILWPATSGAAPHLTVSSTGALDVADPTTAAISNLSDAGTITLGSSTTLGVDTLSTSGVPIFVGPGTLSINVGGTATLAGNSPTLRGGVTFVNNGTTTLPASTSIYLSNRSIIKNNGTFTVGAGSDLCDVDRSGSYFWNTTSGIFDVNGASATVHVPTTNNGTLNVLSGNVTLYQGVLNTGTFNIGDHLVTIGGTYTASSAAAVNVTFDANGKGVLAAGSGAHLAGTTTVTVAPSFTFSGASVVVCAVTATGAANTSSVVVTGAVSDTVSNTATGTRVTINEPPAITSLATATLTVGTATDFQVSTAGLGSFSYAESGALPAGVTFATSTGLFSGTPSLQDRGVYHLALSATDPIGTATQNFTLTVSAPVTGCTLYWTGATSSAWETASNWSSTDGGSSAGRIPNSTDTVCFSTSPVTSTVTLSSPATIAGIEWPSTPSVTPSLTVNWNGSLDVTSDATAAISNLSDAGTITLGSSTTLGVDTLSTSGVPIFVGPGTLSINVGGTATLAGNSPTLRGGVTFVNNGTTTLPASTSIYLSNRSIIKNNGTFTVGAGSDLCDVDRSGSYFWNTTSGIFDVNGASATVHVPTTNNGTLNVLSGNVTLYQGVLNTGTFNIGDHLVTIGGTYTASSAAAVNVTFDANGKGVLAAGSGAHLAGTTTVTVAPSFTFSGASVVVCAVTATGAANTSSVVVTGASHESTSNTTTGTKVTIS